MTSLATVVDAEPAPTLLQDQVRWFLSLVNQNEARAVAALFRLRNCLDDPLLMTDDQAMAEALDQVFTDLGFEAGLMDVLDGYDEAMANDPAFWKGVYALKDPQQRLYLMDLRATTARVLCLSTGQIWRAVVTLQKGRLRLEAPGLMKGELTFALPPMDAEAPAPLADPEFRCAGTFTFEPVALSSKGTEWEAPVVGTLEVKGKRNAYTLAGIEREASGEDVQTWVGTYQINGWDNDDRLWTWEQQALVVSGTDQQPRLTWGDQEGTALFVSGNAYRATFNDADVVVTFDLDDQGVPRFLMHHQADGQLTQKMGYRVSRPASPKGFHAEQAAASPSFSPQGLPPAIVGQDYNVSVYAYDGSGAACNLGVAADGLPDGLGWAHASGNLSPNALSGKVTGDSWAGGVFPVTLTALDGTTSLGSTSLSLSVVAPTAPLAENRASTWLTVVILAIPLGLQAMTAIWSLAHKRKKTADREKEAKNRATEMKAFTDSLGATLGAEMMKATGKAVADGVRMNDLRFKNLNDQNSALEILKTKNAKDLAQLKGKMTALKTELATERNKGVLDQARIAELERQVEEAKAKEEAANKTEERLSGEEKDNHDATEDHEASSSDKKPVETK